MYPRLPVEGAATVTRGAVFFLGRGWELLGETNEIKPYGYIAGVCSARYAARRNWLIYRCFRVAKTSKKAELDYAVCTNCFIQMQFRGRASFADCKGEFKEAIVLDAVSHVHTLRSIDFLYPL